MGTVMAGNTCFGDRDDTNKGQQRTTLDRESVIDFEDFLSNKQ